ncbi:hypothetical protein [Ruegeria arenilitoris]|uniref:hypothetical protein n=1 Tax=Ruegeria arenilitoris TaxID=1173585 RepID=UPI001481D0BF|nr:hypothetical protein [Ruegeria arenilitoris]
MTSTVTCKFTLENSRSACANWARDVVAGATDRRIASQACPIARTSETAKTGGLSIRILS